MAFVLDDACLQSFNKIKKELTSIPIITALDWNLCDTCDYVVRTVLGQRKDKRLHVIHYVSKVIMIPK